MPGQWRSVGGSGVMSSFRCPSVPEAHAEPTRRAGPCRGRHGQLLLVLLGLSFLKVAFVTDPRTGVRYVVVVSAFAVGFASWTLYVDGVLPLGFPPTRTDSGHGWLPSSC